MIEDLPELETVQLGQWAMQGINNPSCSMTMKSLPDDDVLLVRFTQVKKHGVERREKLLFAAPVDCGRFSQDRS